MSPGRAVAVQPGRPPGLAPARRPAGSEKGVQSDFLLGAVFVVGDTGCQIWIGAHGTAGELHRVEIAAVRGRLCAAHTVLGREAERQFAEYFRRPGHRFTLPLRERGTTYTSHHRRCMEFLKSVPAGNTRSYAQQAAAAGHRCARAAGQANRRNLFPVIIPCHRVIAQNGSLGGFMGARQDDCADALALKRALLEHERQLRALVPALCQTV